MVTLLTPAAAEGLPQIESYPRVSRTRYTILQALVGIMLAYQLFSGSDPIASPATMYVIVAGLAAMVVTLLFVPLPVLQSSWFSGLLIGIDTILVTATIYLSGNARSDLYLSYFVLMLIAASLRRFSQVIAFSLLLCTGYGFVLYQGVAHAGAISVGHLLGIPVLLVMATFYGMAMETIGMERQQKARLLQSIDELKRTEDTLQQSLAQLQHRIKGLKEDLSKANAHVQQGQVERQGLERQLVEAQKMEAVARMTGGIANEFSHLFSVIGKQTGLVLSRLKPGDPLFEPVDQIFRSGERAAALTAQLAALDIQQREFRHVLPVNVIVEDLWDVIRGLLPAGIECHLTLDPSAPHVEVDREGLEQALLHVVVNARDAMSNRGRLSIEVTGGHTGGQSRTTDVAPGAVRGSWAVIQVADTGTGMTRDTQSRMFEPFFSTKETNVGLGLTAVYGIVKRHGGSVEVVSQPGQGTRVSMYLPSVENATSPARSFMPEVAARGDETVLLVEPHEIERKLALGTLLRHRYRVLEASSPVEALMLVQQHTGGLHVAVSGLIMPEISGRELAKQLLKQYPTMKALFVSGYDDEAIRSHRINRRFLLRRPYRQSGLVEKVRELIDA
ncbi:MAG TPA: ATP-binding protein [Nitrospira sp.]|nr:ATP-binding protein [Nitrospira sp.]